MANESRYLIVDANSYLGILLGKLYLVVREDILLCRLSNLIGHSRIVPFTLRPRRMVLNTTTIGFRCFRENRE